MNGVCERVPLNYGRHMLYTSIHSTCLQSTHSQRAISPSSAHHPHTLYAPSARNLPTSCTPSTHHLHTVNTPSTNNPHTIYRQSTHNSHTIHTYNLHTICAHCAHRLLVSWQLCVQNCAAAARRCSRPKQSCRGPRRPAASVPQVLYCSVLH